LPARRNVSVLYLALPLSARQEGTLGGAPRSRCETAAIRVSANRRCGALANQMEQRMTEPKPPKSPSNQGEAVRKAIAGDRNIDIDRWQGFSAADTARQAQAPPQPLPPLKPLGGLARDGGPAIEPAPTKD
jgi:hypothetical protein